MAIPRADVDMWHVLRVFVGRPIRIAELITEKGFTAYCPTEVIERSHPFDRSKIIWVKKPLFPGYLFVLTREGGFHWSMIEDATTRVRFYCIDNRCIVLDQREMDHVRAIEAHTNAPTPPAKPPRLAEAGETVKILNGAFYGRVAEVVRVKRQRAEVRLKQGLDWAVTFVRLDQIELVEPTEKASALSAGFR